MTEPAPADDGPADPGVVRAVHEGLSAAHKYLPPWLFYDRAGSELYEHITRLPEYYPTRTEYAIFERYAAEIVDRASAGLPLTVLELGAGSATKTQVLLHAVVRAQGRCHYLPADVSLTALAGAVARLGRELPEVQVTPVPGHHSHACAVLAQLPPRQPALFIGSSIGNYDTAEAVALLTQVHASLAPGGALLLGADAAKGADILVPAYDDAQGVTAAFNLNLLTRINRELGGEFHLDRFAHLALWNADASRIEMHLVAQVAHAVWIQALGLRVHFAAGEHIHTESSVKYTPVMISSMLAAAGFSLESSFFDAEGLFGVHLARRRA